MHGSYDFSYFYKWLEIWFRFCSRNANLDMFNDIATGDLQFSLDKKANGGVFVLYGLAFVPVALFLMNGIILRHPALVAASLVFGVFHFLIVKENMNSSTKLSLPRSESERKNGGC